MNFKKPLVITAGIVIGAGLVMSVNAFTIQSNLLNAVATFQQFFVTTNGFTPNGSNEILSVNSGGKVIFHNAASTVRFQGIDASGTGVVLATDSQGNLTTKVITGGSAPVSGSQWISSGTDIFYNSGNVGIGITNPIQKLDINGAILSRGALSVSGTATFGAATFMNANTIFNNNAIFNTSVYFTGSTIVTSNGNLGLGETNPTVKLHVNGNSVFSGNVTTNGTTIFNNLVTVNGSGINSSLVSSDRIIVGNNFPQGKTFMSSDIYRYKYIGPAPHSSFPWCPWESDPESNDANLSVDHYFTIYNGPDCIDVDTLNETHGHLFSILNDAMIIITGGKLGVGTRNPSVFFQVGNNGDGTIARSNSWSTFSDERFKNSILPITYSLNIINNLQGVSFIWNVSKKKSFGFIAQNIEKIIPEIVETDKNGYKSVDYNKIVPFLVEAIKEQQVQINELKKELQLLKLK